MATRQQLEQALINADRAGDVDAARLLAAELTKVRAEEFTPPPAGAAERFAAGAVEPIVGLGQLASRGLSAVGSGAEALFGQNSVSDYLQELPARNDQVAAQFGGYQRGMAPEGTDFARLAGNVATTLPAAFAGGAPTSALTLARAGAVQGGLAGAAQPVTDVQQPGLTGLVEGGSQFGPEKIQQTATGAAVGAVAAPLLDKLLRPAVMAVSRAYRAAVGTGAGKTADQIKIEITNTLQNEGIDVAALGDDYLKARAADIKKALDSGGELNVDVLANEAAAKSLGINLTRGQATQDPIQFGMERFIAQAPGGEELSAQYTNALAQSRNAVQSVGRGLPEPQLPYDAGTKIVDAIKKIDAPRKDKINQLYDAAKNAAGRETPVDARKFVDDTLATLEKDLQLREVPGDIQSFLNTVSKGQPLTIGRAEEVIQALNGRIYDRSTSDSAKRALITIKKNLDNAIETTGLQAGDDTARLFRQARTASAVRAKQLENLPTIKSALDDEIAPEDMIRGLISKAKYDEFKASRAYLRANDRGAWDQVRSQVADDLLNAGTRGSDNAADFSGAGFRKALDALRNNKKLGLLFSESEIRKLNSVAKVSRLVQTGPPDVSRTGFGGSAKALSLLADLVSKIKVPFAGPIAGSLARKGTNIVTSARAMTPAPVTTAGPSLPLQTQTLSNVLGGQSASPR